jgi:DNA modification methylase
MKLGPYEINQIYNEDSYQAIKNIPDKSIDCIYTDVPYLHQKGGIGKSDLGYRIDNIKKELESHGLNDGINYSILDDFVRVMKHVNIIIWCSKMQFKKIFNYFTDIENIRWELIFWGKKNPAPIYNNCWIKDKEMCIHFYDKHVTLNDEYNLKSTFYVSSTNKEDKENYLHPNIKPLPMVIQHIKHITHSNDIVADFFLGSGTTCVGAKELNRNYIGFEINPLYHTIAKDRLNGINKNGQMSIFTDFEQLELEKEETA